MHTEKKRIPGMYFFKRNIGTIIGLILLIIVVTKIFDNFEYIKSTKI